MPILSLEPDLFPANLFDLAMAPEDPATGWWALYTRSRREKDLMRHLLALEIPFYCPIIPRRYRSPAGRVRTTYLPLFSNYVFLYGDEVLRYQAVTTGCVSRHLRVPNGAELTRDLRQLCDLIRSGVPLTPESRLEPGDYVRIRSGPFRRYEGTILRREGQLRLLVHVNFLQQGASFVLDECQVELV
jgi:hypothetical protein